MKIVALEEHFATAEVMLHGRTRDRNLRGVFAEDVLSGYEVRAVTDDKQFTVLSSSKPFGRGSPKVRTTSARTGEVYSRSGRKKSSSATPADFSLAIADRTTSWLMSRVR